MPPSKAIQNFGDVVSVGQLARQWERPVRFVKDLVATGQLVANEHGLVTNESLRAYYAEHGNPLR